MRKVIAAMNMSLDGFCDHTELMADDEIHAHYNDLLRNTGTLVYGRITYQLMESFWPGIVKNPSGNKQTDEFAVLIDDIRKVVFSNTLTGVQWKNSKLVSGDLKNEIEILRQQPGKDIAIGSPGLIAAAMNLGIIDEYQFCVQPVILGLGLSLFKNIQHRIDLKLIKTKTFNCGAVTFYYQPA